MVTTRTAQAVVQNYTNVPIKSVSLVHKYSNNHKNLGKWPWLAHGESSTPLDVQYNTGAFTTGRDWWLVSWYSADYKTRYYSAPNNFRAGFDSLEQVAGPGLFDVISAAQTAASSAGTVVKVAATVATNVAAATVSGAFNGESTDGFKQHILRGEDANRVTEVALHADGSVHWRSASGNSATGWTSRIVS